MQRGDPTDAIVVSSAANPATLVRALRQHPEAMLLVADGGLAAAVAIDAKVDVIVGDFDSIDPEQYAAASASGAAVERHRCDKDATDLELAVKCAVARGASRVVMVDSMAGRLDHALGGVTFLASGSLAAVEVRAYIDDAEIVVVRSGAEQAVPAPVGATVTLLPVGGAAVGITTNGLRYPLSDETLLVGSTRGVSNVVEQPNASVALRAGTLLMIVPDASATEESTHEGARP